MLRKQKNNNEDAANVTVEMAIISVFVLLPILAGSVDFFELVAARSQVNAALTSFYAFAWNNPNSATDTSQLGTILAQLNHSSLPLVTFPDGKVDGSSTYIPTVSYTCSVQTTPCPTQDIQKSITYNLISKIMIPLPFPFVLTNPFIISASGQVQIQ